MLEEQAPPRTPNFEHIRRIAKAIGFVAAGLSRLAAKCGAYAVDVQAQFANGSPAGFGLFIRKAVRAVRDVNKKIIILAGLATNNPHVQVARNLATDYHEALTAGVQGLWLNAKNWQSRNQCAAAQGGPGCPQTGIQFLEDIGLIGGT